jgi:hypothetical protein
MLYVVVIEKEGGEKDYKVFGRSSDAIRRHETASHFVSSREPVPIGGNEETRIIACAMFKAATEDVRKAVNLVEAGLAEPLVPQQFYAERPNEPSLDEL